MNSIGLRVGAIGLAIWTVFYPQASASEAFTGTAFLSWPEAEQRGYLDAQVVMASSIVTRAKPEMSACLAKRFYDPNGLTEDAFTSFVDTIAQYETYHPSSVLVVVLEDACGAFY